MSGPEVVTACTAADTGAVVASPTTSLPEVPGGDRQFDYRFCWLRDSAQAVSVAALGKAEAAEKLLGFLRRRGPDQLLQSPVFNVRGGDVVGRARGGQGGGVGRLSTGAGGKPRR